MYPMLRRISSGLGPHVETVDVRALPEVGVSKPHRHADGRSISPPRWAPGTEDLALTHLHVTWSHRDESAEALYQGPPFPRPKRRRSCQCLHFADALDERPSRLAVPVSRFITSGVAQRISLPLCISPRGCTARPRPDMRWS